MNHPANQCHANRDGDCMHTECPQVRDGEPHKTGRNCPLDTQEDDSSWLAYLPLPINFEGVKSGFRRARESVGMEHVNFHDLRHSCATLLLSLDVPLHVVRDILGHTSIKTTERYAHAQVAPQREALSKLGDLHQDLHQKAKRPLVGGVSA